MLKLDSSGSYQWHTFYGLSGYDYDYGIATDGGGNVFVTGISYATWNGPAGQSPLHAHSGGYDIFVLKLDSSGSYQWHTFYGSSGIDYGYGIATDGSGNVYVTGSSSATWNGPAMQNPLHAYSGSYDIFVLKLDSSGSYQWHTFYGSSDYDYGYGIATDGSGNVYITGSSSATWNGPSGENPLHNHSGHPDIMVLRLPQLALWGSISGRVTKDSDGTGIQNVEIWVHDSSWNFVNYNQTDSSGNYTVGGFATGSYYVYTQNSLGYIDEYYNNVTSQSAATLVSVTDGTTTPNINFGLVLLRSISGRVTKDSDGTGIQNVNIQVYDSSWNFSKSISTDSSGNYKVGCFPTGSYYVRTWNTLGYIDEYYNNVTSQSAATLVNVTQESTTPNINFGLPLGGSISGRVTKDSDGEGIRYVEIWVYDSSWNFVNYNQTDRSGNYTVVGGLATGSYYVRTRNTLGYIDEYYNNVTNQSAATLVSVTDETTTPNINFGLVLGGSISGRVIKDSDGTVLYVGILVYDSSSNYVGGSTDSSGNYTVWGLLSGNYYVRTSNSQGYVDEWYDNVKVAGSDWPPAGATVVSVAQESITANINFSLSGTPLNDTTEFVKQQYRDFLDREGDSGEVQFWVNKIDSGAMTKAQVIESFFWSNEFGVKIAPIVRLYFAYYLRIPDYAGLMFWIDAYNSGWSLGGISDFFASSPEFITTYGSLTNEQFVTLVYQNVLGRAPDAGGYAFWVDELNSGRRTRGRVMLEFSESTEYKGLSNNKVYVTMMYIGMLRRSPDEGGFNFWVNYLDNGNLGLALIDGFLNSQEYAARFQ